MNEDSLQSVYAYGHVGGQWGAGGDAGVCH